MALIKYSTMRKAKGLVDTIESYEKSLKAMEASKTKGDTIFLNDSGADYMYCGNIQLKKKDIVFLLEAGIKQSKADLAALDVDIDE